MENTEGGKGALAIGPLRQQRAIEASEEFLRGVFNRRKQGKKGKTIAQSFLERLSMVSGGML
jgi:hypothetical protein